MENLADELQAIADEPESDPVEDFRAAGQRLVDALRDQFADGQVEALYSLQTAAAQLKQHTQSLVGAAAAHSATLQDLIEQVVARTTSEVSSSLQRILAETQASIGEQLAAEVDASSTELRGAAQDHAQAVASQLEVTSNHLTSLYDGVVARTEDARQGLEWVAQQGAEQLTAAASTLHQHRVETEQAIAASGQAMTERLQDGRATLDAAAESVAARLATSQDSLAATGEALTDQVRAAGAGAQSDLAAGAESAGGIVRETIEALLAQATAARDELHAVMLDARKAAEEELIALRKQIQAAEQREEAVAVRLQKHVEDLVARTDATVAQSLHRLRAVADALLERDAQLERRRADEFARVLQSVLSEGGASTRRLRDRIFRGMEAAKAAPPSRVSPDPVVSSPPEQPLPKPAAQPAEDVVTAAAPTKTPAKKTPAKKAPAKKAVSKAPAKKAPTPKKSAPKTPTAKRAGMTAVAPEPTPAALPAAEDVPDQTTPVQEEQA